MNVLTTLKWVAAGSLLFACGGGTRPEDMSAADHEKEARRDEDIAQERQTWVGVGGARADGSGLPGSSQFAVANSFRRHAASHEAAAKTLRTNQVSECAGLPEAAAHTCPLMAHQVTHVEAMSDGVRVTYAGAEAQALLHHAQCHTAQGAVEGRKGMEGCPLYEKALRLSAEPAPGGAVLVLSSDDPAVRKTLQGIYVSRK